MLKLNGAKTSMERITFACQKTKLINKYWVNISLGGILLFNSIGSIASLLLAPDLVGYSAVAGAALSVAADSVVTDDLGAKAAVGIGASTQTKNIYSGAAVAAGAFSNSENIFAIAAAGIAANASAKNIYAGAAAVLGASASAKNIYSGAAVSLGASSSSHDVYAVGAITGTGTNSSSVGAGAITTPAINAHKETFDIEQALIQIDIAQKSLSSLEHDFELGVGLGSNTFVPGIYKGNALTIAANSIIQFDGNDEEAPLWVFNLGAALVVGAGNRFEIINAGPGASVIWNLGGALDLGAGTSFVGTAFVTGAVTAATSNVSCGNLFATAAIGVGSIISTNCAKSDTWTGSVNGLADGVEIINGTVSNRSFKVPEPSTGLLMSGLVLILLFGQLKSRPAGNSKSQKLN
jgi:hypothetical protein